MFMIPLGFLLGGSAIVGNQIGNNNPWLAKKYAILIVLINFIVTTIMISILCISLIYMMAKQDWNKIAEKAIMNINEDRSSSTINKTKDSDSVISVIELS